MAICRYDTVSYTWYTSTVFRFERPCCEKYPAIVARLFTDRLQHCLLCCISNVMQHRRAAAVHDLTAFRRHSSQHDHALYGCAKHRIYDTSRYICVATVGGVAAHVRSHAYLLFWERPAMSPPILLAEAQDVTHAEHHYPATEQAAPSKDKR